MFTYVDHLSRYHELFNANVSNNEFIACHLRNARCFSTNIQIPNNTFASTKLLYVGIKSCEYEIYSRCYR